MHLSIWFLASLTGCFGLLCAQAAENAATNAPAPGGSPPPAQDDATARKFLDTCAGCHSIGGGQMMGPDLITAASWPKSALLPAIKRMEQRVGPIADAEVEQYADFIKDPKAAQRLKAAESSVAEATIATLEPASAPLGRDLFFGAKPFANGGMACNNCHQVNGSGGMLGRDLTAVKTRMAEPALQSAIQKPSFIIMGPAYKTRPVTAQEALHLAKYLGTVEATATPPRRSTVWPVGAGLAALFLAGLGIFSHQHQFGRREPLKRRRS